MPAKKTDVLGPIIFGKADRLTGEMPPELQKCINHISKHPWNFLTAVDPFTKKQLVYTRHEKNKEIGADPFPNKPYLKHLVHRLLTEPVVWVPKSRQMIVTTTLLGLSLWEILFRQSQRIILSKVTEDEAVELLENKVRFTYNHLPEWLRSYRPIPDKPKDKVRCSKTASYILAAAENTANRECRGGTATRLIVDEGAYQDRLQEIIEAGQPMTERVDVVSTANASYPGGRYMKAVIHDEEIGVGASQPSGAMEKSIPTSPMQGIREWRTKKNWLVLELHYTADEEKRSTEWKKSAMDSMPDLQSYNREFEIDWQSTTGLPFYPIFYQKFVEERSYFVRPQSIPKKGVIYRGFDFGFRKPACVWAHHDTDGRIKVLREFSPEGIDVYQFRDAIKVISGELDYEALDAHRHERAITWLDRLEPKLPWFEPGMIFVNFAGPEAMATYTAPGREKNEMNDADVFQGGGIHLHIINQRVSAGTYIIRNLMRRLDSDGPGLLVDPSCTTLIQGLAGGLTFGIGTKATPLDDEVADHPVYSHLHDGLRYLVCGVINVSDLSTKINKGLDRPERQAPQDDRRAEPPRYGPGAVEDDSAFWASVEEQMDGSL